MAKSRSAVIYCRVSTEEQAVGGSSLASQETACRKFAMENGYAIEAVFIERGESAKTQNRTEFRKLLDFCAKEHKRIAAVIVWKTDRLTRSMDDLLNITKNLEKVGISVLTVTEANGNTPEATMIRNMNGVFAQYENDKNSERTKAGIAQAVREGRWLHAPRGYEFGASAGKRVLFPDAEAKYVVLAFELAEKGIYTQEDIRRRLKKGGFDISKQTLNKTLRNSVYAALLPNPDFEGGGEKYLKAIHQPLIAQDVYFKVQAILDGKRPAIVPKQRNNPEFPLRRYLKCKVCGRPLTGSKAKGKFPYYHCMNKGCPRYKRDEVEASFYEYLKFIRPRPELLALLERVVMDKYGERTADMEKARHRLSSELEKLRGEKERVRKLVISGTFSDEDYKAEVRRIAAIEQERDAELRELSVSHNAQECWSYAKTFLAQMPDLWRDGDLPKKQRFQSLFFPEGFSYDGKNIGTAKLPLFFQHFYPVRAYKSNCGWLTGFEPATSRATAERSNR